jgi:hypothetical protein
MKWILIGFWLFLSSCATNQVWVHPNFSQAQLDADRYRCQQEAWSYAQSSHGLSPDIKTDFLQTILGEKQVNYDIRFRQCMEFAGYHLEEKR